VRQPLSLSLGGMKSVPVLIAILALLSGCAGYEEGRMDRSLERARSARLERIDSEQCSREGGTVEGVGMFGMPACVHEYSDAGKGCSNGLECEGSCFVPEMLEVGQETTGVCQSSERDSFGCISLIESGKVASSSCAD